MILILHRNGRNYFINISVYNNKYDFLKYYKIRTNGRIIEKDNRRCDIKQSKKLCDLTRVKYELGHFWKI